ncbi:hypothetical protein Q5752_000157 [Cryptotrichosporon argae]
MPTAIPTLPEPQGARPTDVVAPANGDHPAGSGSSAPARAAPPATPYLGTSQYRHWRYTAAELGALRAELNAKSREVTAANVAAEQQAQLALGQSASASPPPPQAYLTVDDELLLVRFYCAQAAKIARAFGLPEAVEATAMSYIRRFYLKNSVMEWHPKNIMPTCLFLAAKTTNHPIPIDVFVSKLSKVTPAAVLDLEFLVAQSLAFEFWVRGADKAVRGWALELQTQTSPPADVEAIQRALPRALAALAAARHTDAEFLFSPSQIALACWRLARKETVDGFLDWKYASFGAGDGASGAGGAGGANDGEGEAREAGVGLANKGAAGAGDGDAADAALPAATAEPDADADAARYPYGLPRRALDAKLRAVEALIGAAAEDVDVDVGVVKAIDRRLRACTNPEKVPGTALYIKRKAEQEAAAAEARAAKAAREAVKMQDASEVFGGLLPGKKAAIGEDAGSVDLGAER